MGICISSLLKSLVRKGFFVLIGVVAVAGLTAPAQATPVTYTFSGDAGGYVNSVSNNFSGAFTLVVNADTTAIDLSGPPYSRLNNVNGTFTEGSYSATLTGVTIVANADPSFQNIDFYNAAFNNGLGLSDPVLNGYNLTTSIGPITVTSSGPLGSFLTPTFGGGLRDYRRRHLVFDHQRLADFHFVCRLRPRSRTLHLLSPWRWSVRHRLPEEENTQLVIILGYEQVRGPINWHPFFYC